MPGKNFFSSISLLAILCSSFGAVVAQQQMSPSAEMTVIGMGTILANDVAAARDQAIDDALRKAVQQALGTQIKSETLVQNFQLVDDQILSWSAGYVKKYDILREGRTQADTYEVQMRAEVDLAELRTDDDAVAALLEKENPRVMVMIAEQNIGDTDRFRYFEVDLTAAETAIIDVLRSKNFEVVDAAQAKENQKRDEILSAVEGNAKAAAAIAAAQQAELIITGKAVAKVAAGYNLGGMKSCQANITTRIVSADDAKIIATASEHAAYPHIDELTGGTMAIEKAAKKCAETLVKKVADEAQKRFYNQTTVNLRVQGYRDYTELQRFSNSLKFYMRGVKNINQRSAAGGYANLDIQIVGNAKQLARELASKNLSPFEVEVTNVTANRVDVKISQENVPAEEVVADSSDNQ